MQGNVLVSSRRQGAVVIVLFGNSANKNLAFILTSVDGVADLSIQTVVPSVESEGTQFATLKEDSFKELWSMFNQAILSLTGPLIAVY